MKSEAEKVVERYQRRKELEIDTKHNQYFYFDFFIQSERELAYLEILNKYIPERKNASFLEIGSASGGNIFFFAKHGFRWENIYANELRAESEAKLRDRFPKSHIHMGDVMKLDFPDGKFDVIFQSTVFTSLLDAQFKKDLAAKLYQWLKPGGVIIWYDFIYDNPKNKDVKGVSKKEIKELFPHAEISFKNVTLLPPLARKFGKFYNFFNAILFPLRTHVVATLRKLPAAGFQLPA